MAFERIFFIILGFSSHILRISTPQPNQTPISLLSLTPTTTIASAIISPPHHFEGLSRRGRGRHHPPPSSPPTPPPPQGPSTYDHFRVSLTWPATFCLTEKCGPRPSNDFSLHGIWPAFRNGTSAVFLRDYCFIISGRRYPLNIDLIKGIPLLNKVWYSLLDKSKKDEQLWKHEWEKHGYCAMDKSEVQYFTLGRDIRIRCGDITRKFGSKEIYPGGRYSLDAIESAFRFSIGAKNMENVIVKCDDMRSSITYLASIEFCTAKDGTVISCPSNSHPSCTGKRAIMLPK